MASDPKTNFDEEKTKNYIAVTENDPITHMITKYSILHYAGDVSNKSVLDIGCGTGLCCRAVKEKKASEVMGVDISQPMVDYANSAEAKTPLGIHYRIGDGKTLGKIGEYDFVFTNYVLIFMDSVENLEKFVQVIYDNLKPGGKFVGMQFNCFSDDWFEKAAKFDRHAEKLEDLRNGKVIKFTCTALPKDTISVTQYYFDLPTYQEIFKKVGFRNFTVNEPLLDESASKKFPETNFKEYLETHSSVVLVAEK